VGLYIIHTAPLSHYPDKWSVEGNHMKGPTAEAKAINIYLDILKWQGV